MPLPMFEQPSRSDMGPMPSASIAVAPEPRLRIAQPLAPGSGRVELIDAVRGLACLWVLLHHSHLYWGWRVRRPVVWRLERLADIGYLGVHLFLVISGFVLLHPVVRRHGIRGARVEVAWFLCRRARRILPPYYIALAGSSLLCLWPLARHVLGSPASVRGDLLHMAMLFNLDPASIATINGSFWSLALEFQLYLAFPLLLWVCRRAGLAVVVGGTLAVAVLWQNGVAPRMMPPLTGGKLWLHQAVWYYAVPGRCFEFAMGMAAAAAVARPRRYQTATAAAVVALLTPVAAWLVLRHDQFGPARDQLWGVVFAAGLVLAAAAPAGLSRSAPLRLCGWLGGISYSVYLLHQPLLQLSRFALDRLHVPAEYRLGLFLLGGVPALVGLGVAFHRWAERPFMSPARPPPRVPVMPSRRPPVTTRPSLAA